MKNYLIVFLLFFLGTTTSFASHSMGADLTYEHITGNTYEVTLKFYRDCSGISAPSNPIVQVASNGCPSTSLNLSQVGFRILPTSCGNTSTCFGGSLVGAEEYIYRGLLTLSSSCTDYNLSFSLCCRNNAITTLQNPGIHDFYIETKIKAAGYNNNSPEFTGLPVIYTGIGQQVIYNHGVIDPDGDQLVFSLVDGLDDANFPVNYSPGLSGTNPLYTTGPTTIDSNTGQVIFTPSIAQVGIISVRVEEYRSGVKIGEATRDMQIIVANNNNNAPIVSGINGTATASGTTGPFVVSTPSGSQLCFNLAAFDVEGNTVTLTATAPPAAVFTSTPGTNTAQFCWTPTASDIGTHLLTVFATDNGCPYSSNNSYVYQIDVFGANGQCSGSINASMSGNTATLTYTGPPVVTYLWDFGDGNSSSNQNPVYSYSAPGTYAIQLTTIGPNNETCVYATTVVVHTAGCDANFTYDADFFYPDVVSSTATYFWDFGDGTTSTLVQPTNDLGPGTWNVCLSVLNCGDTCSTCQVITVGAACDGEISSTAISHFTYQFDLVGNTQPVSTYSWGFGDGNSSTLPSPIYTYTAAGNYVVTLNTLDTLGNQCYYTDTLNVCPTTTCDAGFTYEPFNGVLIADDQNNSYYHWYYGNGGTIGNLPVQPVNSQQGTYLVCLSTITPLGDSCVTCDTIIVGGCLNFTASITTTPESSAGGDGTATVNVAGGVTPFTFVWSDGQTSSIATGLSAGFYCATVTDANGCLAVACDTVLQSGVCDASFTHSNGLFIANDLNNPFYYWFNGNTYNSYGNQPIQQINLSPGTHLVCLNTGTSYLDTCITCVPIVIPTQGTCDASFTYLNGVFTANDLNNQYYYWDLGDGTTSNQPVLQHTYNVGTYLACLYVETPQGDSCQTCDTIYVNTPPPTNCDAGFTYNNGLFAADVINSQQNYYWRFGDGTYGYQPVIQHAYTPGTYIACLEVSTLSDTCQTCDTIIVLPQVNCDASFTYLNGVFTANDLTNSSYFWDFGDGALAYQPVVQHGYSPGAYLACLYVNTQQGDSCQTCDTIRVFNFNISGIVHRSNKVISNNITVGLNGSGKPYAGLGILLEDLNGNRIARATTDLLGRYEFNGIQQGDYVVRLDAGSVPHKGERVYLDEDFPTKRLDFTISTTNSFGMKGNGLDIYPNPTTNEVTLQLTNNVPGPSMIYVKNGSGELVLKKEVYLDEGINHIPMNLLRLPAGLYFVSVQNDELFVIGKVVKVSE